jgi:hypothetical protein
MIWNISLICFLVIFAITTFLSIFSTKGKEQTNPLKEYILGNSSLKIPSVISLLLSSSFGLNAIFLQIYLGFQIGFWSLLTQLAWCLSFVFLSKYSKQIREYKSLHELVGARSDYKTRILAGSLTLIGICFLMAWEFSIGNTTFSDAYLTESGTNSNRLSEFICYGIVAGCLLYTVIGGLKGNAIADVILNLSKILIFTTISFFMLANTSENFSHNFFPSIDTMVKNMGWWGLITNIIFSVSWQFVDNSTWQSIIAGQEEKNGVSNKTLNLSGLIIFLIPGVIGTIIGVYLAGVGGIDDKNILTKTFLSFQSLSSFDNATIYALLFISVISCMMSLLDGLFLSSSYTLVTDIFYPKKMNEAFQDNDKANKVLLILRACLVIVAFVAIWGITTILKATNDNIFNYVYLVVVPQLALLGAVLHSLIKPNNKTTIPMWILILIAVSVGLIFSIVGSKVPSLKWMSDGSGAITAIFSVCIVFLTSKKTIA